MHTVNGTPLRLKSSRPDASNPDFFFANGVAVLKPMIYKVHVTPY